MSDTYIQIGLIVLLVIINAAFAGSELALVSLRDSQVERLRRKGGKGQTLSDLVKDPNQYLATIQIGITLAGFLASATAAVSLAAPLIEPLDFLGGFARPVAILIVTLILTFFTLVLGELVPKRIALQRAEGWALFAARPVSMMSKISKPVVMLLSYSTDLFVKLLGGDPTQQREVMTNEELRDLLVSRPELTVTQRDILSGALDVGERSVGEIVVDRTRVVSLSSSMEAEDAVRALLDCGHSRAPVEGEGIDDLIGVVHLRELIGRTGTLAEVSRPIEAYPASLPVMKALGRMRAARAHLAAVVDEYGGTEGIVTIEDLLEEIVGEIYDEFDQEVQNVRRSPDGSLEMPGNYPIHDLEELGLAVPDGPYSTIAGYVMFRLGTVAKEGDLVEDDDKDIEVLAMDNRAIGRVRITPRKSPEAAVSKE